MKLNLTGLTWGPSLSPGERRRSRSLIGANVTGEDLELMKLGLESERHAIGRSIQRDLKYRWPNSKVPYRIEAAIDQEKRTIIASVMLVLFIRNYVIPIFNQFTSFYKHQQH